MVRSEEKLKNTYLIFLNGLGCKYDGISFNDLGFDALRKSLTAIGFPLNNTHFLLFSYTGGKITDGLWIPQKYGPEDTGQSITWSLKKLEEMVEQFSLVHPEAKYILIGHSLGGRIALDFVNTTTPVNRGKIKGIITLNSPLVGAADVFPTLLKRIFNQSTTVWGSTAVSQLIWECSYTRDLTSKRREMIKNLQKDGIHIATFASERDLLVSPISSCITDDEGKPITEGFIIKDQYFSFKDILGHMLILEHPLISRYIFSLSTK